MVGNTAYALGEAPVFLISSYSSVLHFFVLHFTTANDQFIHFFSGQWECLSTSTHRHIKIQAGFNKNLLHLISPVLLYYNMSYTYILRECFSEVLYPLKKEKKKPHPLNFGNPCITLLTYSASRHATDGAGHKQQKSNSLWKYIFSSVILNSLVFLDIFLSEQKT